MARVIKRLPIAETWARNAFCKGKDHDLWDLDAASPEDSKELDDAGKPKTRTLWKVGRRHCVRDCTIRENCLRKALQSSDFPTEGVVRGGVPFTVEQRKKKKAECLFCHHPIAPVWFDSEGNQMKSICWICRNYAMCLRGCGRMVLRRPGVNSYHCSYCNN